jgi:hypothetical protein
MLIYAITLLALVGGVVISLKTGDWTWLSRSGSAMVALGIILTSREILDHSRRLKENRVNWEARIHHNLKKERAGHHTDHDWATENSIKKLIRSRSREEDIWEIEFRGFYLLVAGTLIWGFGDLVGNFV